MTENQRLKILREILNLSQGEFSIAIGRKQGSVSDIERGRNSVDGILELLKLKFNVNPVWLKTGEGEMFLDAGPEISEAPAGVPYFNVELSKIQEKNLSMLEEEPEYYVNFRPFNDCTAYLPVYGDSMYPKYASGEIIAVKEINNHEVILWGEAYLVITNAGSNNLRTIKLLFEHPDPSKIILRSSNPNYKGDTVIERGTIFSLYIIKGKITRSQM